MDKGRYVWNDDEDKQLRVRYDSTIAQKVESLVMVLPRQEKCAIRARYVDWPHFPDERIARRLGMSEGGYQTILMAAHVRFSRLWNGAGVVSA